MEYQCDGEFWINKKNNTSKKFHGRVEVDDDGFVSLEVFIDANLYRKLENDLTNCAIDFLGTDLLGKKISLLNCTFKGCNHGLIGDRAKLILYVRYLIIGTHYSIESMKIKNFTIEQNELISWVITETFSCYESDFEQDAEVVKFNSKFINEYLFDRFKLWICINYSDKSNQHDFNVSYNSSLSVTYNEYINLNQLYKELQIIKGFFNLFLRQVISTKFIIIETEEHNNIKVYINGLYYKKTYLESDTLIYSSIKYNDIKNNFELLFKNWLNIYENIWIQNNFMLKSYQEDSDVFLEADFINIVQSIESFSRNFRDVEYEPDQVIENILNKLDNIERNALIDVLRINNEPNLRKRLTNILRELDFLITINSKNRKSIVEKIVDTRNYYTHLDKNKKDYIKDSQKLLQIKNFLRIVLWILILMEVGVAKDSLLENSIFSDELNIYLNAFLEKDFEN